MQLHEGVSGVFGGKRLLREREREREEGDRTREVVPALSLTGIMSSYWGRISSISCTQSCRTVILGDKPEEKQYREDS